MVEKTPAEIARATLKLLSARQLAPTPENYQTVYHEVAGLAAASAALPPDLAEQLARTLELARPAFGGNDERLREMVEQLLRFLRQPEPDASTLQVMLQNFGSRLSFVAYDQAHIRTSLLQLLHLILNNMAVLCVEDQWLHGQVEQLQVATRPPLSLAQLHAAERSLKDVIAQQSVAKDRLVQAQNDLRAMLSALITRLTDVGDRNAAYHAQLEDCSQRLSQVSSLHELAPVLAEVMQATRTMTEHCNQAREELQTLRARSEAGFAEIDQLRQALEHTSAMARQDAQTGVLNRRGLAEAVALEMQRASLTQTPVCIAMLDLDNFKAINDRMGHDTGDRALEHLVGVARQVLRSQDHLGRHGGEEFVFIFPATTLEQGVEIMKRLQRALTTRYFLQGNERVLITFSAGVAQIAPGEEYAQALVRADQAMYQAKHAGKNRVVAAPMP